MTPSTTARLGGALLAAAGAVGAAFGLMVLTAAEAPAAPPAPLPSAHTQWPSPQVDPDAPPEALPPTF